MDPVLVPVTAAAEALSISKTRVFGLIASGELESVRVGKSRLISAESVRAYGLKLLADARAS